MMEILNRIGKLIGNCKGSDIKRQFYMKVTPALVVNNKVRVAGRVPTKEEIKKWIKDAVN
jgi:protein-disulfide isomerase